MKEQGKGEGDKRTDRLLTGISISLVCDTKNKAIIATSPNDICLLYTSDAADDYLTV